MKLSLSWSGRTFLSFWIFGLVNNVLYVVILSAAIDLVGPEAPKAIVLLADVLPALIIKLTAPFYIHLVPYWFRIYLLILLSFTGMLSIAYCEGLSQRLFGVVLASASSGLGEISFLQLTHFYDSWSLDGFSSGTGAAGLVGSFVFLVLTSWIGISTKASLIIFSMVPFSFFLVYNWVLPSVDNKDLLATTREYLPVDTNNDIEVEVEDQPLTSGPSTIPTDPENLADKPPTPKFSIIYTLRRLRPLVVPFM